MPTRMHLFFSEHRTLLFLAALLPILTGLLFWPAVRYELVSLDDIAYISENQMIHHGLTGSAVREAFTGIYKSMWAPGLWISYMLDFNLYGTTCWGLHLTNVLLHAANALLAFILFWRWTHKPWRAFWAAAIWAWHPLRVESVAWVAARKDVLSGLFFLACLLCYDLARRHPPPEQPDRARPHRAWMVASLLALAAGLTVKPMLVTVPVVLLLMDVWPLRRLPLRWPEFAKILPRLVAEKAWFWLLAATFAALAFAAHAKGSSLEGLPLGTRLLSLPLQYTFYLVKTVYPVHLTVLYPDLALRPVDGLLSSLLLLIPTVWVWRCRHRSPAGLFGWLWFLVVLLPASGIVRFGIQSLADRFTYLPALGFSILALPLFPARRPLLRGFRLAVAAALLLTAAGLTHRQLAVWHDSDALHDHLLRIFPAHTVGLTHRAARLRGEGHLREAEECAARACATSAASDVQYFLQASILASRGKPREACDVLLALDLRSPGSTAGQRHFMLAMVLNQLQEFPEAARHARLAADTLSPRNLLRRNLNWLGLAISCRMDDPEAAQTWARNLPRLHNRDRFNENDLLPFYIGQWQRFQRLEAVDYFRSYLDRNPGDVGTLNNLAWLMATAEWSPMPPEEIEALARRAAEQVPGHPGLLDTLGVALAHAGRFEAAKQAARQARFFLRAIGQEHSDLDRAIALRLDAYQHQRPWREEQAANRLGPMRHAP